MIYHILQKLKTIYKTNFILIVALASTTYIHSSLLGSLDTIIPVGILFAFGSLGALITTLLSPIIFERFGVKKTIIVSGILSAVAFSVIGFSFSTFVSILFFIIAISTIALIVVGFDIIIEHLTKQKEEGEVRGINLALGNLAFLIGPIIAGIIAEEYSINSVYFFSALVMLGMVWFFVINFRNLKEVHTYKKRNIFEGLKKIISVPIFRRSYIAGFLVEFFFATWAIFTTLYMHEVVGFNWQEIGLLFAIMHIPYILIEPLVGDIADKYSNEHMLMPVGLAIIAVSFVGVALISNDNIVLWAILLILTRVGASFGQVAHESYFFKRVNKQDTDTISAYRSMAPLALLLGPFIGSMILLLTSYQQLFIIVSIVLLVGTIPASRLLYGTQQ